MITLPTTWRAERARQQRGPASDEGQAGLIDGTSRDYGVNEAHSGTASPTHQGRKAESKLMAVLCVPATGKTTAFCRQVRRTGAGGAESGLRAAPSVKFSLGK